MKNFTPSKELRSFSGCGGVLEFFNCSFSIWAALVVWLAPGLLQGPPPYYAEVVNGILDWQLGIAVLTMVAFHVLGWYLSRKREDSRYSDDPDFRDEIKLGMLLRQMMSSLETGLWIFLSVSYTLYVYQGGKIGIAVGCCYIVTAMCCVATYSISSQKGRAIGRMQAKTDHAKLKSMA